jgi:ADP-ribose pyrophosphatase YjhB (NUDIX family)
MADVGYSLSEIAAKEVQEETGLDIEITSCLGIYDCLRYGDLGHRVAQHMAVYKGRPVGGELRPLLFEVREVTWFDDDEIPPAEQLVRGGDPWLSIARNGGVGNTFVDPVRIEPEIVIVD